MKPASIPELASEYGLSPQTASVVLARPEFNKFCLGRYTYRMHGKRKSCLCYNNCVQFSNLFKRHISRLRRKPKLVI